jgi:hypothetical protein
VDTLSLFPLTKEETSLRTFNSTLRASWGFPTVPLEIPFNCPCDHSFIHVNVRDSQPHACGSPCYRSHDHCLELRISRGKLRCLVPETAVNSTDTIKLGSRIKILPKRSLSVETIDFLPSVNVTQKKKSQSRFLNTNKFVSF